MQVQPADFPKELSCRISALAGNSCSSQE